VKIKQSIFFSKKRCAKAVRSKTQLEKFISNSNVCRNIDYVFADCMKAASGTCRGLFDNYLDYLPMTMKLRLKLRYPRTFFFHKRGRQASVIPISDRGRLRESHLGDQARFDRWCSDAMEEVKNVHGWA
jgi:hypothetical protein